VDERHTVISGQWSVVSGTVHYSHSIVAGGFELMS
jgi:hypothetical protein